MIRETILSASALAGTVLAVSAGIVGTVYPVIGWCIMGFAALFGGVALWLTED